MDRIIALDGLMSRLGVEEAEQDDFITKFAAMLLINSVTDEVFQKTLEQAGS